MKGREGERIERRKGELKGAGDASVASHSADFAFSDFLFLAKSDHPHGSSRGEGGGKISAADLEIMKPLLKIEPVLFET